VFVAVQIVDYEAKSHYELTVQVSDARNSLFARSSTVPVIIDVEDVNEYTPRFTRFFIQVCCTFQSLNRNTHSF